MKFGPCLVLFTSVCILGGCGQKPPPPVDTPTVEMIFWEYQSWESGGGSHRLTLWPDGRSEVLVRLPDHAQYRSQQLVLREGWALTDASHFVRRDVFSGDIARRKFEEALKRGIHLLETFQPGYVDGSGTLVGLQVNGELQETVIPLFLDRNQDSENHRRFMAVSEILSDYDWQAFDMPNQ